MVPGKRIPLPQSPTTRTSFGAKATPTAVRASYDARANPGSPPLQIRCPAGVCPTAGSDGHIVIAQPDGTVFEACCAVILSSGPIVCPTCKITSPARGGDGWQNGVRASLIPVHAGLIRKDEVTAGLIHQVRSRIGPLDLPAATCPVAVFATSNDTERYNMVEKTDWEAMAASLLKAERKRRGVTYAPLVEKRAEIGVDEKEVNVRNKPSRGKFTAAYLRQCLTAPGSDVLRLWHFKDWPSCSC